MNMIPAILPIPVRSQARVRREQGLSLIELMISMVIGLILLLGITSIIVRQSTTRAEMDKSSQQIENGRYAIQLMHDDIEHAGFYSYYYSLLSPPATLPDPCLVTPLIGAGSLQEGMTVPIQGYTALPVGTCATYGLVAANYKPGTQILVVRRVDTNGIASPFTSSSTFSDPTTYGSLYLQANITNHILDVSPNTGNFTLAFNTNTNKGIAPIYQYMVHIYFISPCNVPANGTTCNVAADGTGPDDNGRPIPTLKRLELTGVNGTTKFTIMPLAEGIEDMQFQYGIDSNNDGYPDNNYVGFPATTVDWTNVMSVAVNLLAQNTQCTLGYSDTNSYNLGAGLVPAATYASSVAPCSQGDYKRHVFNEVVRAVNLSGRRAAQ